MRRVVMVSAVAVVLAVSASVAQDGTKADIRGSISKATAAGADAKQKGNLGTLLVEGTVEKGLTQYDKAWVRITAKTKIEKMDGKDRKAATFDDLKAGARVQATFTGPVAESYPVQATAGEILILEPAKK